MVLKEWLDKKLERKELICLDGGFSAELEKTEVDFRGHKGWTARANFEFADEVQKIHENYIKIGCDMITTNTYHHSFKTLTPIYGESRTYQAFKRAVNCAHVARLSGKNENVVKLLLSIGSYGVNLNDGSEYRGDYAIDANRALMEEYYEKQCSVAKEMDYDGCIFETIPTFRDVTIILEKCTQLHDVIISLSCNKLYLRDECPIQEVLEAMIDSPNVIGVGINCSDPRDVVEQIQEIIEYGWVEKGRHIFVYPNSGQTWVDGKYQGEKVELHELVRSWHEAGAIAVGGCCQVDLSEMKKIVQTVCNINNKPLPIRVRPSPTTIMPPGYTERGSNDDSD